MNGVDYSNKYSRETDLYRKNLQEARKNNEEQLAQVKENAEKRIESQSDNYKKQVDKLEKNYQKNFNDVRSEQASTLKQKTKEYNDSIEANQKEHNETTRQNVRDWNNKFSDLKRDFRENKENMEKNHEMTKADLEKNYNSRVDSVKKGAQKEVVDYQEATALNNTNQREAFDRDKKEIINRYEDATQDIVEKNNHERKFFRERTTDEINKINDKQTQHYLDQRNTAEAKFNDLNQRLTDDQEFFQRKELNRVKSDADREIKSKIDDFAKRFAKQEKEYNASVRDMNHRQKAEKISQGNNQKDYNAKRFAEETQKNESQVKNLTTSRNNLIRSYEDKIDKLHDKYQNEIRSSQIDNTEKLVVKDKEHSKNLQQKELKDRHAKQRLNSDNHLSLKLAAQTNEQKMDNYKTSSKEKIDNLKKEFNEGMENIRVKSKIDMDTARLESDMEKKELQKRLHEQNSSQNAYIKKVYADKLDKTEAAFEKRILELENQNKSIRQEALDALYAIREETRFEIERQRNIAMNMAKSEVETEREVSRQKQNDLRSALNKSQADFAERLEKLDSQYSKKLKDVTRELSLEKKREAAKFRDIIAHNEKYYLREMERIKMSSDAEKEGLITQYEDRIKQLQKINEQKLEEMKNFNKLSQA